MIDHPLPTLPTPLPDAIEEVRRWVTGSEGELMHQLRTIADLAGTIYDSLERGTPVANHINSQDFETLMRRSALAYAWAAECAGKRDVLSSIERMTRNHLRAVPS